MSSPDAVLSVSYVTQQGPFGHLLTFNTKKIATVPVTHYHIRSEPPRAILSDLAADSTRHFSIIDAQMQSTLNTVILTGK